MMTRCIWNTVEAGRHKKEEVFKVIQLSDMNYVASFCGIGVFLVFAFATCGVESLTKKVLHHLPKESNIEGEVSVDKIRYTL